MAIYEAASPNETFNPEKAAQAHVYLALNSKAGTELLTLRTALATSVTSDNTHPSVLSIVKQALTAAADAKSQFAKDMLEQIKTGEYLNTLRSDLFHLEHVQSADVTAIKTQITKTEAEIAQKHSALSEKTAELANQSGVKAIAEQITTTIRERGEKNNGVRVLQKVNTELTNILMDASRIVGISETTTKCDNPHDLYTCELALEKAVAKLDERVARVLSKARQDLGLPNPKQSSETEERNTKANSKVATNMENIRESSKENPETKRVVWEKARKAKGKIISLKHAKAVQIRSVGTLDPFMRAVRRIVPVDSVQNQIEPLRARHSAIQDGIQNHVTILADTDPLNVEDVMAEAGTLLILAVEKKKTEQAIESICTSPLPTRRDVAELAINAMEGIALAGVAMFAVGKFFDFAALNGLRQSLEIDLAKNLPGADAQAMNGAINQAADALSKLNTASPTDTLNQARIIVRQADQIISIQTAAQHAKEVNDLAIKIARDDIASTENLSYFSQVVSAVAGLASPFFLHRKNN